MMKRLLLLLVFCVPLHAATIVIVGDSVAHGAGDESGLGIAGHLQQLLGARVVNAAVNGSRTWNVDAMLSRVSLRDVDAVVVSIGGNDLYGDRRAQWLSILMPRLMMDLTLDRVSHLVRRVHRANAKARVILLGLYNPYGRDLAPYVAIWDSKLLARFARDERVTVVRIADLLARRRDRLSPLDHFHPGAAGYALIARRIAEGF